MIPNIVKDKQPYKTEMYRIIYVEKCAYFVILYVMQQGQLKNVNSSIHSHKAVRSCDK